MNLQPETKIFVIDDDESVRRSITLLLYSGNYLVESFHSTEDFLFTANHKGPGCIILDIFTGGKTGLELQDAIADKFTHLPIIYITGQGDIPMSVQALKKGAINFLQKPFDDKLLFSAVNEALKKSLDLIDLSKEIDSVRTLFGSLTIRETEIFRFVIRGLLNKQIAAELNIAEHTVKLHRGKITAKLGVKSVPEMVHIADKLGIK